MSVFSPRILGVRPSYISTPLTLKNLSSHPHTSHVPIYPPLHHGHWHSHAATLSLISASHTLHSFRRAAPTGTGTHMLPPFLCSPLHLLLSTHFGGLRPPHSRSLPSHSLPLSPHLLLLFPHSLLLPPHVLPLRPHSPRPHSLRSLRSAARARCACRTIRFLPTPQPGHSCARAPTWAALACPSAAST